MITKIITLAEYQLMFSKIYDEHNNELYTIGEILSQIWEKISRINTCISEERQEDIKIHLPILLGWLMALWNQLNVDISEAAWFKYPNICPYCFRKEKCSCITKDLKYTSDDRLNSFRKRLKHKPKTFSQWEEMFARLYGSINKIRTASQLWFHFVEEIAEISREIRHKNNQNIRDESADAFAWLISFSTKIGTDLGQIISETYNGKCNICLKERCVCPYT